MLRIGKMTDYALLIMGHLAKEPYSVMSASLLAQHLHLTLPTVSKILKILSDANLVNSMRGAEGGYRLSRPAIEITVADIINAMEGAMALTKCCESVNLCGLSSACTMKENWQKINTMVHALLSKFTIIDMTQPLIISRPIEQSNGMVI